MPMRPPLAVTPPLGWNSFDCYNASVTEAEVRANAEVFARRLAPLGWEYIVIDFCWSHPRPRLELSPDLELRPDGTVVAELVLDELSRQLPAPNRFPSAASGSGFAPLGTFIHSLGLKFGIHVMRGIPRQAVEQNLPIVGRRGAAEIADTSSTCSWLNHMYGVDMAQPGAQAYYDSLLEQYAAWEVDYLKVDDMGCPYHAAEVEALRRAIERCGRPMVLSLSPGPAPLEAVEHLQRHANLWRISADFWDSWEQLRQQFDLCRRWTPYITPGAWPDADMLPLGRLSVRGPQAQPRWSNFTPAEQRAMLSLFAIVRSPLMIGSDLPSTDEVTFALLTNPEVLAVNQQSRNPRVLFFTDEAAAWVADASDGHSRYVALFNFSDASAPVVLELHMLEISSNCAIRDLWAPDMSPVCHIGRFAPELPAHGGGLYKLTLVHVSGRSYEVVRGL